MDGNILTGQAPEKDRRQNGNTAFRNMPSPNKPAAPLPATDNHHTITNTLMTNTKLSCCVPALLLILSLTAIGCRKNPVVDISDSKIYEINLSVVEAATEEVYLKIEKLESPGIITVKRDSMVIYTGSIAGKDTVIIDEKVTAQTTYHYQALVSGEGRERFKTPAVVVTTLGLTNNNFTCTFAKLGFTGYTNDVCVIDENNIWVVGRFEETPRDTISYNAALWNGSAWKFFSIYFSFYDGYGKEVDSIPFDIYSVYSFSKNDVWFCNHKQLVQWNGTNFHRINADPSFIDVSLYKIWGTDKNNIYGVGKNGTVVYFNGTKVVKLPTDTDNDLMDVYGKGGEVYAVGAKAEINRYEGVVLKLESGSFKTVMKGYEYSTGFVKPKHLRELLCGVFVGIWMSNPNSIYVCGTMFYQMESKTWNFSKKFPDNQIDSFITKRGVLTKIKGNAANDIIIAGDGMFLSHYNGSEWKQIYQEYNAPLIAWAKMDYKHDVFVTAGNDSFYTYVLIGKRSI